MFCPPNLPSRGPCVQHRQLVMVVLAGSLKAPTAPFQQPVDSCCTMPRFMYSPASPVHTCRLLTPAWLSTGAYRDLAICGVQGVPRCLAAAHAHHQPKLWLEHRCIVQVSAHPRQQLYHALPHVLPQLTLTLVDRIGAAKVSSQEHLPENELLHCYCGLQRRKSLQGLCQHVTSSGPAMGWQRAASGCQRLIRCPHVPLPACAGGGRWCRSSRCRTSCRPVASPSSWFASTSSRRSCSLC